MGWIWLCDGYGCKLGNAKCKKHRQHSRYSRQALVNGKRSLTGKRVAGWSGRWDLLTQRRTDFQGTCEQQQ